MLNKTTKLHPNNSNAEEYFRINKLAKERIKGT